MSSINSESPKFSGLIDRMEKALGTTRTSEIANLLAVSASLVSDWRAGRSVPALSQLLETARLGHTTIDWLITGNGPGTLILGGDEQSELLNNAERTIIENAARGSNESIHTTLRSLINDGLTLRGHTPFARDVIDPVLSCLNTMQPKTRARVAELLVMSLEARLRGRIQDWSLAPDEWQGVSNPGSKTKLKSSTERTTLRKLTRRLKLPSTGCRKDHVFGESSVLIFDGRIRTRTMPLVGEVMSNGEVKKLHGSQKAKVPEVFYQDKRTNYSLLRLRGNSFAGNEIGDGTLLIYEARKNARNGQLAVAMIEGKTMVTWFERDEHRIRLQSLNGNQASLNVEGEQKVQIVGVVVGLVRPAA